MQQMADSEHSRRRLKKYSFLIVVPYVIGVFISLFAPLDVLKYEFADLIYRCASAIFPAVRQMKGEYEIGQVSKLYFSVMWLFSPAMFWYFCLDFKLQAKSVIQKCRKSKMLAFFLYLMLAPVLVFFTLFINIEPLYLYSVRDYLTFYSRYGINIYGFSMPAGASGLLAMILFYIGNFNSVNFE